MAAIPDSDMISLLYPAIYEPYKPSQIEGVEALALAVWQYAAFCPDTKMILLGYSQVSQINCNSSSHKSVCSMRCANSPIQGAHVVADVMCGTSSVGFPATAPQPPIISSKSQSKLI
jgi:hypothetical protein